MTNSTGTDWVQFLNDVQRSQDDAYLAGVCGGLGKHSGIPAWCFRALFVTTALFFWAGLLAYIALWVFMPIEETTATQATDSEVGARSELMSS